jgi:5'-3' exonuclease
MGITGLFPLIGKYAPNVSQQKHLSEFFGKSVAIDVSIFIHKFTKSTYGNQDWISQFILFLCKLRKYGIKPVCVFDGPNCPKDKKYTQDARRALGDKKKHQIKECKRFIERIKKLTVLKPNEIDEIRLLLNFNPLEDAINYKDIKHVTKILNEYVKKVEQQNTAVTKEHSETIKKFLGPLGLPYIQADGEAEKDCAYLCKYGYTDYALSNDSDTLAYGCPHFITKLDMSQETVIYYNFEDVLTGLNLESYEQFKDLCIMLKTDYNRRVKGLGPVNCYKLIQQHSCIENIEENIETIDTAPWNYRRCREIFSFDYEELPITDAIPLLGKISTSITEILKKYNVKLDFNYIEKFFLPPKFILLSQ